MSKRVGNVEFRDAVTSDEIDAVLRMEVEPIASRTISTQTVSAEPTVQSYNVPRQPVINRLHLKGQGRLPQKGSLRPADIPSKMWSSKSPRWRKRQITIRVAARRVEGIAMTRNDYSVSSVRKGVAEWNEAPSTASSSSSSSALPAMPLVAKRDHLFIEFCTTSP